VTLEVGDILTCQTCGEPLLALERDILLHLADDNFVGEP
jgi:hypothetical protein